MKEFFRTFLAVILAQILLGLWGLLLVVILVGVAISKTTTVPKHALLVQSIGGEIPEYAPPTSWSLLEEEPLHHTSILENLEKAAVDHRIDGVVLQVGMSNLGMAKRTEIRRRIDQLKKTGKPVVAFARYLSTLDYFMIAGCDSIFMPPQGVLVFHGLAAEAPFFKGTLDKLGIKANLHRIAEYKSAAEPLLRENMSEAARENAQWIVDAAFDELLDVVSGDRQRSRTEVLELMEQALFNPSHAVEVGLVDRLRFWEDIERDMVDAEGRKIISGADYADVERSEVNLSGTTRFAVVHAQGVIGSGENGYVFPFGLKMGSASMRSVLNDLRDDSAFDGVMIRVDSPGGESIASDEIGYAVKMLADTKPTVISMVDVAASGGYMMSYRCSTIVASPTTLTGSIGSITGKFNIGGFYDLIGVTKDFVTAGPRALINSDYRDFTEEEWEIVGSRHWQSYEDWIRQIGEMRGLSTAAMDSLARGRVWTGRQAQARRLIDHVGGFDTSLELLRAQAGVPALEGVELVHFPKPKSFLERLLESDRLLPAGVRGIMSLIVRHLGTSPFAEPGPLAQIAGPEMATGVWPWRIR